MSVIQTGVNGQSTSSDAAKVRILNSSGETIPGRSFVRITGGGVNANGQNYTTVGKPDDSASSIYLVSDLVAIPAGAEGMAFDPSHAVWVAHATAPTPVEEVGPADGEWTCAVAGEGFNAIQVDAVNGLSLVKAKKGSGGGSGPLIIRFSIIYAIPSEQYAVCLPLSVPDGYTFGVDTNIPGADDSGQITIYDRVGCFLDDNDPAAFIDRDGYAVYLRSQTTTECEDDYSSGGLGWEMTHLCCDTTVCEG
jgi:hypothetical protein